MSFLGTFLEGQSVTFRVTWTLAPDATPITGSTLTLISPARVETIIAGVADGIDVYKATSILDEPGRWEVQWRTSPAGGIADDEVYVDLT